MVSLLPSCRPGQKIFQGFFDRLFGWVLPVCSQNMSSPVQKRKGSTKNSSAFWSFDVLGLVCFGMRLPLGGSHPLLTKKPLGFFGFFFFFAICFPPFFAVPHCPISQFAIAIGTIANLQLQLQVCSFGAVRFCDDPRRAADALLQHPPPGPCPHTVVGIAGGFNKWDQLYDRQLRPRDRAAQQAHEAMLADPIAWLPPTQPAASGAVGASGVVMNESMGPPNQFLAANLISD